MVTCFDFKQADQPPLCAIKRNPYKGIRNLVAMNLTCQNYYPTAITDGKKFIVLFNATTTLTQLDLRKSTPTF